MRLRVAGRLAVGAGLLVLALLPLQLVTGAADAARVQQERSAALDAGRPAGAAPGPPPEGAPIARLRIPRFGADWSAVVSEGTTPEVLDGGPGHYAGTALPGRPGNTAIAGHRVSRGGVFRRLDELRACDPIVLEADGAVHEYRVLPPARPAEAAGPAGCAGAAPLGGAYADATGRQVVDPSRVDVLAPVPGRIGAAPDGRTALLTLTTCHPEFSDRQRLVVQAVLVGTHPAPA